MVGLYFHIPFCQKKCPYCHFYVIPNSEYHRKIYEEALFLEWEQKKISQKEISTLYFGGGTPSLFPEIACKVMKKLPNTPVEVTFEMNPEDITEKALQMLKDHGINRISLGVQSFNEQDLIRLGRKKIETPIEKVAKYFDNISIDLMYDIPHQTEKSFQKTLDKIQDYPITHVSLYNLTIEPHTSFYKKRPVQPDDHLSLALHNQAIHSLKKMSFERYEISAFAKNGKKSTHNLTYWQGKPFLGLGPSAFSYIDGMRFSNHANIMRYYYNLKKGLSPIGFQEKLDPEKRKRELLAIRLRILEGVDLNAFEREVGSLNKALLQDLELLEKANLIEKKKRLQLTEKGLLFYDEAMSQLI